MNTEEKKRPVWLEWTLKIVIVLVAFALVKGLMIIARYGWPS